MYERLVTPEDEVRRLETYRSFLEGRLEETLQQADRLVRQIEDVDQAIVDEKSQPPKQPLVGEFYD